MWEFKALSYIKLDDKLDEEIFIDIDYFVWHCTMW